MNEQIEGKKGRSTAIKLSPARRKEILDTAAVTGASRHTILETVGEFVDSALEGKIMALYQSKVLARAKAAGLKFDVADVSAPPEAPKPPRKPRTAETAVPLNPTPPEA